MQPEFWLNRINPKTNKLYNFDDALSHIRSFKKCNVEYWTTKGYSEDEAKIRVSKFQKSNSRKFKKIKSSNPQKYDHIYNTKIEYWINKGYSEDEAKIRISNRQRTFTKEKLITKYGDNIGLRLWTNRQEKWQNTLKENNSSVVLNKKKSVSLNSFIKKYGTDGFERYIKFRGYCGSDENLLRKAIQLSKDRYNNYDYVSNFYKNLKVNKYTKYKASKESLFYFIKLYKVLRKKGFNRGDILFGIRGSDEFCIKKDKKKYYYDFCIPSIKLIIEYNGIRYHPNKDVLSKDEWDTWKEPYKERNADEKYKYDLYKENIAKEHGYDMLILWSNDSIIKNYLKIEQCLKKHGHDICLIKK